MSALALADGLGSESFVGATDGDTFDNSSGRVVLLLSNTSGGDITVEAAEVGTGTSGETPTSQSLVFKDDEIGMAGPFGQYRFNSSGTVTLTYSGTSNVTVAAVKLTSV